MRYEDHQEFFAKCGDKWLQPKEFGECLFPVKVEEMYQHFKARLKVELAVDAPDLRAMGVLVDATNPKE